MLLLPEFLGYETSKRRLHMSNVIDFKRKKQERTVNAVVTDLKRHGYVFDGLEERILQDLHKRSSKQSFLQKYVHQPLSRIARKWLF